MQRGAARGITESIGQGSETQFSPGENAETGRNTAFTAVNAGDRSSNTGVNGRITPHLSGRDVLSSRNVSGRSVLQGVLQVPCAPHESEPGHTYRLARSLFEEKTGSKESGKPSYEPFPADLTRVPVPDAVLDRLDELSGCAARLCLLMVRASYSWVEDLGKFRASSRWFTTEDISEEAGGLGMHRESLRRAAHELEEKGWIAQRKEAGKPTAYRWRLSVPRSRYTPIPAPLLHAHQALSHSALTLLLSVLRATWGWTARDGDRVTYRRTSELTTSELEAMTGLSRPTVRDVQEELRAKGALYMRRRHGGAPWEYAADLSFFRHHLQKSCPPTNREENSNKHTHAGEPTSGDAHGGENRRRSGSAYKVTQDWEEQAIRLLSADPIGMRPAVARDLVIRRSRAVVEGAIKAFRRRRSDIKSPVRWMHSAIKDLWFAPSIPNKSPDVRQSSGEAPIAQAFEALTETREGWEWDEEDPEGEKRREQDAGADSLNLEETPGVTHPEMCDLIEDLRQPDPGWQTVERQGRNPLFVPTKELANWAYFRRDSGSEQFQKAARRVVNLRARHEGRDSPLGGE